MRESFRTTLRRWAFNFFPAYRRTGARLTYMSDDLREIHIKLPLGWRTRNYVGTMFGGSMFGAADPIYMVMFINVLGRDYIVWDKSATIHFKKPGKSMLTAKFIITDDELEFVRSTLESERKLERTYTVELRDADDEVCAVVEKLVYFRRKR